LSIHKPLPHACLFFSDWSRAVFYSRCFGLLQIFALCKKSVVCVLWPPGDLFIDIGCFYLAIIILIERDEMK
jgi:hypothetical protein